MTAGEYNFVIEQGTDFTRSFQWKDSNDDPINLTGYSARMMARTFVSASTTIFSLTSSPAAGLSITAATGTVTMTLSDTTTAAFDFDTAVYDLELVSGAGVVTRLLQGTICLSREVTR